MGFSRDFFSGSFCRGSSSRQNLHVIKVKPFADEMTAALVLLLASLMVSLDPALAQEAERGEKYGWLEVDPAIVGKPAQIRWRLAGEVKTGGQPVLLNLTISHLEKGKTVFAVERLPVEHEFTMNFQFADGAEYRVSAIAYAFGGRMLRTEQNIAVTGVEPPMRAMIPAMGFFLAVIALGLAVGRWSRRAGPS